MIEEKQIRSKLELKCLVKLGMKVGFLHVKEILFRSCEEKTNVSDCNKSFLCESEERKSIIQTK